MVKYQYVNRATLGVIVYGEQSGEYSERVCRPVGWLGSSFDTGLDGDEEAENWRGEGR